MIIFLILENNFESISNPRKDACSIKNTDEMIPKQKKRFEKLFNIFLFLNSLNKAKLFFQYKIRKIALNISKGLNIKVAGKYLAVLLIETSPCK